MKKTLIIFVLFLSFQVNADNLFIHYPTGELKFGTYLCNVSGYYYLYTDYGEQKFESEKINFKATIKIIEPEFPNIILEWIDGETGDKMNEIFFPFKDNDLGSTLVGHNLYSTSIIILSNEYDTFRTINHTERGEYIMRGECE